MFNLLPPKIERNKMLISIDTAYMNQTIFVKPDKL